MRFRFSIIYLTAITLIFFAINTSSQAQSNEELLDQLRGKAEGPQRNTEQLTQSYQKAIDYLLPLMSAEDVGSRYNHQIAFQDICMYAARPGAEVERKVLAGILDKNIEQTEMPDTVRKWFVLQLERIGKGETIPTMVKLLSSEDKHLRDYARRALEKNPDPGATDALLKELSTTTDPGWKAGLINSLGLRKSEKAVKPITKELNNQNPLVSATAVTALSSIGTDECIQTLLNTSINSNALISTKAAQELIDIAWGIVERNDKASAAVIFSFLYEKQTSIGIRTGALNGLIVCDPAKGTSKIVKMIKDDNPKVRTAAVLAARHATSHEPTRALTKILPELPSDTQIQVLGLMADHPDPDSLNVLQEALKIDDETVKSAAIDAISKLGTDAATETLLDTAVNGTGKTKETAMAGLSAINGPGVNDIIETKAASGDIAKRAVAIELLGLRHVKSASENLLKYAADDNDDISAASYKALINLADSEDINALINLLTNAKSNTARKNCVTTLKSVLSDVQDKDAAARIIIDKMEASEGQVKLSLLSTLNALGGQAALKVVSAAAQSQDETTRETGIRTLSEWPDFEAAQILIDIASKSQTSLVQHVLAIRGAMDLVRSNESTSPDQRAELCLTAFNNARRDEEKKMIIAAMSFVPSTKVVERLLELAAGENFKTEAGLAAVELAGNMLRTDRRAAMELAKKIQDMNISDEINSQAERIASGRFFRFGGNRRRR